MDTQLHPELAYQAGIPQEKKIYDVHPSLQMELDAPQEPVADNLSTAEEATEDNLSTVENSAQDASARTAQAQAVQESPKDRDWRAVRAQADEARQIKRESEVIARERDFYREQALNAAKSKKESTEEDYRTDYEKHLYEQVEELKQRTERQEKEAQKARQEAATARAEQKLIKDYPDVYEVVSDDNVERLKHEYPHLYNSAIASSDVYSVGSAAYEFIVAKGIYKKPESVLNQLSQTNVARNQSKPKSVSTIAPQSSGDTPIKQASNFMGNSISSEAERKALYEEMVNSSRNRAF